MPTLQAQHARKATGALGGTASKGGSRTPVMEWACRGIGQHSMQRRQPGHWARPHGNSAVRPCVNLFPVLYPHGNSAVLDGSPLHSGQALLSTLFSLFPTFYILLPVPYFGSPLHSGHALHSTLFSLFSFFNTKPPCGQCRKGVLR